MGIRFYSIFRSNTNLSLKPANTVRPFTLSQAARACKRSKSTIANALETGRLSGRKNDVGNWEIEPAELFRVFPSELAGTGTEPFRTAPENHDRTGSEQLLERLRTLEIERERERRQLESTIEDLRQRLDVESRKVLALLTYKPEPKINTVRSDPNNSPLYRKLFGKR